MGTAYTFPTDQSRLANCLKLDRNQYAEDSLLNQLMDAQMEFDLQKGIDTVATVLADLTSYESMSAEYLTSQGQQGKRSLSVSGEYSVSYANSVQDTYSPRLAEIKARIRRFLDPYGYLLNAGQPRPRVT